MAESPYKPGNNGSQVVNGKAQTPAKKGTIKKGSDLRGGGSGK